MGVRACMCVWGRVYVKESECRCICAVKESEFRKSVAERENIHLNVYTYVCTLASCVFVCVNVCVYYVYYECMRVCVGERK